VPAAQPAAEHKPVLLEEVEYIPVLLEEPPDPAENNPVDQARERRSQVDQEPGEHNQVDRDQEEYIPEIPALLYIQGRQVLASQEEYIPVGRDQVPER